MTLQADSNGNGNSHVGKRGWVKTEQGWEPHGDREKQIVFQIQAGRPTKDIAGQFEVSSAYISRVRRRIGAPDLRRKRKRALWEARRIP